MHIQTVLPDLKSLSQICTEMFSMGPFVLIFVFLVELSAEKMSQIRLNFLIFLVSYNKKMLFLHIIWRKKLPTFFGKNPTIYYSLISLKTKYSNLEGLKFA